ncbi:MAG: AAA family ATPase [Magnetococcales bacterium]|nr:AAA family ATPase [Magnetococcales bacterium]MBF0149810.1 AAA family ATPase [Magnetococcales bacterium]MBF0174959.1 AAA family ATPase [Magnetococcales bacterium]MBF0346399.1 AAA family ATPase [Magnetococcales bacterium]MBF0630770.1 AAA family ATPase [Magnetococcales bacterium]
MIISVMNQKGGCGKTTIAVNLAAVLKKGGLNTIVLDADPQLSASRWAKQGGEAFPLVVHPLDMTKGARKVKTDIRELAETADMIVIDCPPELREPAMLASLLADVVLVPVTPSPLDIWAAEAATDLAHDARELNGNNKPIVILLPSKTNTHTVIAKDLSQTLATMEGQVAPVSIVQRVVLAECVIAGSTIDRYAPSSPALREMEALGQFLLQFK